MLVKAAEPHIQTANPILTHRSPCPLLNRQVITIHLIIASLLCRLNVLIFIFHEHKQQKGSHEIPIKLRARFPKLPERLSSPVADALM
jgi:hypothetical protein